MGSCSGRIQVFKQVTSKRLGVTTPSTATKLTPTLGCKRTRVSLAKLYANENMPLPVVERLRQLGHDVQTSHESGRANQRVPDNEVLQYATESGRAVLTLNRVDFHALHKAGGIAHAGIVTCTENRDFHALADRIHTELERAG